MEFPILVSDLKPTAHRNNGGAKRLLHEQITRIYIYQMGAMRWKCKISAFDAGFGGHITQAW